MNKKQKRRDRTINRSLLIIGASTYAQVACEIAQCMGCYEKVDFVDDLRKETPSGIKTVGKTSDLVKLSSEYSEMVVAIGNPEFRLKLIKKIQGETSASVASLISPRAYVSSSAKIMPGCIIEPMAVIHCGCVLERGCIVSAGAVINHESVCQEGVHVDCNATVAGYCLVPANTKVPCGEVYREMK